MDKIEIGQLRQWRDSPSSSNNGQLFLILNNRALMHLTHLTTVDYLQDGKICNAGGTHVEEYSVVIEND